MFTIDRFAFYKEGSMVGHAVVSTPAGIIFHDVSIHERSGMWFAVPSRRPVLGPDGRQARDPSGRQVWAPVMSFRTDDLRDKFSAAVIQALRRQHPEVFEMKAQHGDVSG